MTEKDMIIQRLRRDNDTLEEEIEKLKNPKGLTAEEKIQKARDFMKWLGENLTYEDTLMTGASIVMVITYPDDMGGMLVSGDGEKVLAICEGIVNEVGKRRGSYDGRPLS